MKHYSSILSENRHINRLIKFIIVSTCLLSFQSSYATYLQFEGKSKENVVRLLKKSKTHQSVSPHLNGSLKSVVVDINRILKKLEPSPANLDRIIDFQTTLKQMLSHLRVDEINYIETQTFAATNTIILHSIQQKTKELEQKKQTGAVPKAKHMSETKLGLALQQGLPEKQIQIPEKKPKLHPYENSGYAYSIQTPGMSKHGSHLLNSVQDDKKEDSDTQIHNHLAGLNLGPPKQRDTKTSKDPDSTYDKAKETRKIQSHKTRYPIFLTGNDPKINLVRILEKDIPISDRFTQAQNIAMVYCGGFTALKHAMEVKRSFPGKNYRLYICDNSYDCQQAWEALKTCFINAKTKNDFMDNINNIYNIDPNNQGKANTKDDVADSEFSPRDNLDWVSIDSLPVYVTDDFKLVDTSKFYEPNKLEPFFAQFIKSDKDFDETKLFMTDHFKFKSINWFRDSCFDQIKVFLPGDVSYIVNSTNIFNPSLLETDKKLYQIIINNINSLNPILTIQSARSTNSYGQRFPSANTIFIHRTQKYPDPNSIQLRITPAAPNSVKLYLSFKNFMSSYNVNSCGPWDFSENFIF